MASSLARFRCSLKATPEKIKCINTKPEKDTSRDEKFPVFTKHLYVSSFPGPVLDQHIDDTKESDPLELFSIATCLGTGRMGKTYVAYRPDCSPYAITHVPKKDPASLVAMMEMRASTVDYVDAVRILEPFTFYKQEDNPLICKALLSFLSRLPVLKYYIVSEYWEGQTSLCRRLQSIGKMSENDARFYILELTDALIFIHEHHKIVRRLCPCSLVIRPSGHLSLVPYSTCDQSLHCGQPCNMLVKNCGDQFYASPEIIFGVDVQFTADWWSVGVILYQLLTGQLPFNGRTLGDLGKAITEFDLHIPNTIAPETAAYIRNLLHKDPRRRLGFGTSGVHEIKRHPYNDCVRWEDVRFLSLHPPFVPRNNNAFPLDSDTGEKERKYGGNLHGVQAIPR